MIRWMCGVEVTHRFMCCEFREILGINYIKMLYNSHRDRV